MKNFRELGKKWKKKREPGSGPLGAVAQASWLGQPSQASDFPADSDWGPGQSEIKHKHINKV